MWMSKTKEEEEEEEEPRVAAYMLIPAIQILSDVTIPQAFGTDMILIGVLVLFLVVTKPCNVCVGIYGSKTHNKFALLVIMVVDLALALLQISLGIVLLVRGSPELRGGLTVGEREACARPTIEENVRSKCDDYWSSDRTAGMRLAWMSMYYQGVREKNKDKAKELSTQEEDSICCGFGPPLGCDRIYDESDFPDNLSTDQMLGKDMIRQRVSCSALYNCPETETLCWYEEQPGWCSHYAEEDIAQANPLGCRYDFGVGICLDKAVEDDTTGCAPAFEDFMNAKIYIHGWIFLTTPVLEFLTIVSACCFCWKRKENDVLPVSYVYDEPFDPIKEGKVKLALTNGGGMSSTTMEED